MSSDVGFARIPIPVLAETKESHAAALTARARGYAAGYADGLRVATAEQADWIRAAEVQREAESIAAARRVAETVSLLQRAARAVSESTIPLVDEVELALVSAAFELAEAVVGHALSDELAAAKAAIARVLGDESAGQVAVVRLNPADLDALGDDVADASVRFVPDAALERGDAIGELPDGWLDARIRTALDRAREALA